MGTNTIIHGKDPYNALSNDSGKEKTVPVNVRNGGLQAHTSFIPSQYDADLTMDGTAQSVALATGTTKLRVVNKGATTEDIRIAFGTSSANAEANLTIAAAAATTGMLIVPPVDGGSPFEILGVPANATHYAVANAVASDTQVVNLTQGV